jgi:S-DNA-T family DNA segregation ATPase FtsK/SpoIIIE|tara:strand:- start:752 stop:2848 length:2097 start_codon:yes stop_codon:yes gene_type:complete
MEIKKFTSSITNFIIKRVIELFGVVLIILSILLFAALLTYSPQDPNFVFSNNNNINNILGFKGSIVSDFFLQSIGLISFLVSLTIFFTGTNIIIKKKILIILENLFFTIIYSIVGTLFLTFYYKNSFWLAINGNGGFVGKFISNSFLKSLIIFDEKICYYLLIIITLFLFLISVNFNLKSFLNFFKKMLNFKIKDKNTKESNYENFSAEKNDILNDTTRVQENFSFEQNLKSRNNQKIKFKLPLVDFLDYPTKKERTKSTAELNYDEKTLEKILLDFGVEGKIKKVSHGPVVTLNEFEPAAGIKVSKVINLSEDIARNTSSESARISTIPGRSTIGIELPNNLRENVYLSEIISSNEFSKKEIKLPIALGKSISGIPITGDLASMPHLLIAGTTGSGKSVCINTIILSLLYKHSPDKCKFILIDPKMLELSTYEGIPHLLCPVITEAKKAASVLGWVVKEMESRYRLMTKEGVRNIDGYNAKHTHSMPYIVVIVDEMSDLMLVAGKEIENYIQKLSQMARAAGIHIIMATQRPSVDVITGTIKANFPTRISFQVSSKIDSRTILGEQGAEQLLGKGDMLFMSAANRIVRIHAPLVSENEIEKINNFLRSQAEPDYVDEILNFADEKENDNTIFGDGNKDDLYNAAVDLIKSEGKASTSFLQRKLQIGYNRAARIMDMMEQEGIVSKANHVGKRDVLKR